MSINEFPETADIETSSENYASRFSGAVGEWFLKIQEKATLKMLKNHSGSTILDVGGGHGQTAPALVQNGYSVTVLGSDENCKNRIRTLLNQGLCQFQVGNLIRLPYPDQSFDVVISYRLIPHVRRWQELIAELSRVAKRCVIIEFPSVYSVNVIVPLLFKFKKKLEGNTRPFTSFKESTLLKEFEQHHFFKSARFPEFFMPMVLHRVLKMPKFSALLENSFRLTGLTSILGSPIILRLDREGTS